MDASVASLSTLLIERDGTCFAETRHLVFAAMLTASDCAAQCHEPSGCRYARGRFRDMGYIRAGRSCHRLALEALVTQYLQGEELN